MRLLTWIPTDDKLKAMGLTLEIAEEIADYAVKIAVILSGVVLLYQPIAYFLARALSFLRQ